MQSGQSIMSLPQDEPVSSGAIMEDYDISPLDEMSLPSPNGWQRCKNAEGKLLFRNTISGEEVDENPFLSEARAQTQDLPLPSNWSCQTAILADGSMHIYYSHASVADDTTSVRLTGWDHPLLRNTLAALLDEDGQTTAAPQLLQAGAQPSNFFHTEAHHPQHEENIASAVSSPFPPRPAVVPPPPPPRSPLREQLQQVSSPPPSPPVITVSLPSSSPSMEALQQAASLFVTCSSSQGLTSTVTSLTVTRVSQRGGFRKMTSSARRRSRLTSSTPKGSTRATASSSSSALNKSNRKTTVSSSQQQQQQQQGQPHMQWLTFRKLENRHRHRQLYLQNRQKGAMAYRSIKVNEEGRCSITSSHRKNCDGCRESRQYSQAVARYGRAIASTATTSTEAKVLAALQTQVREAHLENHRLLARLRCLCNNGRVIEMMEKEDKRDVETITQQRELLLTFASFIGRIRSKDDKELFHLIKAIGPEDGQRAQLACFILQTLLHPFSVDVSETESLLRQAAEDGAREAKKAQAAAHFQQQGKKEKRRKPPSTHHLLFLSGKTMSAVRSWKPMEVPLLGCIHSSIGLTTGEGPLPTALTDLILAYVQQMDVVRYFQRILRPVLQALQAFEASSNAISPSAEEIFGWVCRLLDALLSRVALTDLPTPIETVCRVVSAEVGSKAVDTLLIDLVLLPSLADALATEDKGAEKQEQVVDNGAEPTYKKNADSGGATSSWAWMHPSYDVNGAAACGALTPTTQLIIHWTWRMLRWASSSNSFDGKKPKRASSSATSPSSSKAGASRGRESREDRRKMKGRQGQPWKLEEYIPEGRLQSTCQRYRPRFFHYRSHLCGQPLPILGLTSTTITLRHKARRALLARPTEMEELSVLSFADLKYLSTTLFNVGEDKDLLPSDDSLREQLKTMISSLERYETAVSASSKDSAPPAPSSHVFVLQLGRTPDGQQPVTSGTSLSCLQKALKTLADEKSVLEAVAAGKTGLTELFEGGDDGLTDDDKDDEGTTDDSDDEDAKGERRRKTPTSYARHYHHVPGTFNSTQAELALSSSSASYTRTFQQRFTASIDSKTWDYRPIVTDRRMCFSEWSNLFDRNLRKPWPQHLLQRKNEEEGKERIPAFGDTQSSVLPSRRSASSSATFFCSTKDRIVFKSATSSGQAQKVAEPKLVGLGRGAVAPPHHVPPEQQRSKDKGKARTSKSFTAMDSMLRDDAQRDVVPISPSKMIVPTLGLQRTVTDAQTEGNTQDEEAAPTVDNMTMQMMVTLPIRTMSSRSSNQPMKKTKEESPMRPTASSLRRQTSKKCTTSLSIRKEGQLPVERREVEDESFATRAEGALAARRDENGNVIDRSVEVASLAGHLLPETVKLTSSEAKIKQQGELTQGASQLTLAGSKRLQQDVLIQEVQAILGMIDDEDAAPALAPSPTTEMIDEEAAVALPSLLTANMSEEFPSSTEHEGSGGNKEESTNLLRSQRFLRAVKQSSSRRSTYIRMPLKGKDPKAT